MKLNNIIKPIAFLSIFYIILSTLSFFFKEKTIKIGIEIESQNTIDYLIVGDSECLTSISPMEIWNKYGFTGYNLGVSAQRLQNTYYLLKDSLENQTPKVVMLETNAVYRNYGFYGEANKVFENIVEKNFPIYHYHNKWKDVSFINQTNIDIDPKQSEKSILKGFRYIVKVKPYIKGPYVNETDAVEKIKEVPIYYLNKIVKLCKTKNIQLILYTSPSPVCWSYEKHNGIAAFAKENQLPFIDFNLKADELRIDWTKDTYDFGDHLNFFGAKKVTAYMGDYLEKNTALIDHRKDKKYTSWNKTWEEYLKLIRTSSCN